MEKSDGIKKDILVLQTIIKNIDREYHNLSKEKASNFISRMESFNHTFKVNLPFSQNHYQTHSSEEIDITDGLEDLKTYEASNLKKKDNVYFWDGKEKIMRGLRGIINGLEQELQNIATIKI